MCGGGTGGGTKLGLIWAAKGLGLSLLGRSLAYDIRPPLPLPLPKGTPPKERPERCALFLVISISDLSRTGGSGFTPLRSMDL